MSYFTTPLPLQKGVGESPTHIFMIEVAVPILGTAKNLYKRKLGLFAMYVCTSSVRTYIAKTLKRTIYETLYDAKVVSVNLELLTNSGIVQINLFQICCLLKNGKKKDAWRRHPIYFIIRFKLIAVAERRQ